MGQIPVAQFANASGLESLGNNCYGTTLNSGDFDGIGVEVTADGGSMTTGQLEMSNVDLSEQFTDRLRHREVSGKFTNYYNFGYIAGRTG